MFSEVETTTGPAPERQETWRERALGRSLSSARDRSMARLERFIPAARDLANETGSAAFTVQQVVERAGLSLKSFYRSFAGKDALLLALLEEDSGIGAQILSERIDQFDDPVDRMREFVHGIFWMVSLPGVLGYVGVLVREQRRLSEHHPAELAQALAPLVDQLHRELETAMAHGVVRQADAARDAATIFGLLLTAIHSIVVGAEPREPLEVAEYLWNFVWSGLEE